MQDNERYEDWNVVLRDAFRKFQSRIWTAMPVIVLEDSDGFTVTVVAALKYRETDEFGNVEDKDIAKLRDVPVCWPQGGGGPGGDGGYALTFPIKKHDEGVVIFQSRCLDSWHEFGEKTEQQRQGATQEGSKTVGTMAPETDIGQPLIHTRMHDLSDAMFIPGVRSKPRRMKPAPSTTAAQLRSDNQHLYAEVSQTKARLVYASGTDTTTPRLVVEVSASAIRGSVSDADGSETSYFEHTAGGAFTGKAPAGVTWDAPFIRCTGEVTAKYDGVNVSLSTHRHSQGSDSRGDSEQNTNAPLPGS